MKAIKTKTVKSKPTRAQLIFGKAFGNRVIINARPEGMPFDQFRKLRKEQTALIQNCLR